MYVHLLVHVLCCREKYTYDNFCGVTDADDGMSSCDAELLQLSTTFISQSVFLFCFLFVFFVFFGGRGCFFLFNESVPTGTFFLVFLKWRSVLVHQYQSLSRDQSTVSAS